MFVCDVLLVKSADIFYRYQRVLPEGQGANGDRLQSSSRKDKCFSGEEF